MGPSSRRRQGNRLPKRNAGRRIGAIARVGFPRHIGPVPCQSIEALMLDGLRQFIADIVSPDAQADRAFDDNDYRLAATALLVHVVSIDGEPSANEKRKLHSLIESRFGLDR